MGRILLAFRVFFGVLFNGGTAARVARALSADGALTAEPPAPRAAPPATPQPPPRPEPRPPAQNEAVTLLATLQRDARLVDFLMEDLASYTDDQVGAAARAIHQDAVKVLNRLFAVKPVLADEEGARIQIQKGFDAARFRLTGNVAGTPPYQGTLRHHGWEATRCELPQYTGTESGAMTIAPAEVEIGQ